MTEYYYDRADWHYLAGDFPKDAPKDNAATHIGIYLAWIIINDLVGEFHLEESNEMIKKVKKREITGREFLISECDSKLGFEDFNDEGIAFSDFYYADENGPKQYLMDYAESLLQEPMNYFEVENSWSNYDRVAEVIDERFRSWKVVRKIIEQNRS